MNARNSSICLVSLLACLAMGCGVSSSASSSFGQAARDASAAVAIDTSSQAVDTNGDASGISDSAPADAPARPASSQVRTISFDDLQPDRYAQPDSYKLPREIEELSGKRVRIRGYILPGLQQLDIREFILMRDNLQCCFGPNANPFDCIIVRMDAKQSVDYDIDVVTVEGLFELEPDDVTGDFPIFYSINSAKASYLY
jgi:hypothetical protein